MLGHLRQEALDAEVLSHLEGFGLLLVVNVDDITFEQSHRSVEAAHGLQHHLALGERRNDLWCLDVVLRVEAELESTTTSPCKQTAVICDAMAIVSIVHTKRTID